MKLTREEEERIKFIGMVYHKELMKTIFYIGCGEVILVICIIAYFLIK